MLNAKRKEDLTGRKHYTAGLHSGIFLGGWAPCSRAKFFGFCFWPLATACLPFFLLAFTF